MKVSVKRGSIRTQVREVTRIQFTWFNIYRMYYTFAKKIDCLLNITDLQADFIHKLNLFQEIKAIT
jgi:hypothetical protein